MGIATHLGLFLDMPSIGCAKSVLVGQFEEPGPNPGDSSPLLHYKEQVGVALRTKPRTKPMIISVGHKIDLPTAINLVMKCLKGYRLPEPTRLADKIAGEPETGTEQGTLF
jgi:deoxyribonuclease V